MLYRFWGLCVFVCTLLAMPFAAQASDDLDAMLGQMLLIGFRGQTVTLGSPIVKDIRAGRVGGVVLFDYDSWYRTRGRNIGSPTQLKKLVADLQALSSTPLFIAIDQEGGAVTRLRKDVGFKEFPSAEKLGKGKPEATRAAAAENGRLLASLGINVNFAPVVDVNDNPKNPAIGAVGRSFSASPAEVTGHAGAFLSGLQGAGIIGCLKHFPGQGSAGADSHYGVTDISKTWRRNSLEPYQDLLRDFQVPMIMVGHLFNSQLDPQYPATLSHATLTGLLRQQLGFTGLIVTDDMQMRAITDHYGLEKAVELAVLAGVDVLVFGNSLAYDPLIAQKVHTLLKQMVADGRVSRERIQQSADRIAKLKQQLARP